MSLFDTITHRRNIYKAIYALDSYICGNHSIFRLDTHVP